MTVDLNTLPFQVDFYEAEINAQLQLLDFLKEKSQRLKPLVNHPQVVRYSFLNVDQALNAFNFASNFNVSNKRLLCDELDAVFIQIGNFNL